MRIIHYPGNKKNLSVSVSSEGFILKNLYKQMMIETAYIFENLSKFALH